MSFLEQLKEVSAEAAARAKTQLQILQAKRDLSAAYGELGRSAFELAGDGTLTHERLTPGVERIRALKAGLEQLESQERGVDEPAAH